MIRILILFQLFVFFSASAQLRNPIYSDWTSGYSVGAYGRYQLSSNAITSNLVWNVYQGKDLSRKLRENVSRNLIKGNRIGADADYGIFAKHLPDSTTGIGWFVNLADRIHVNAKYPKDLFDVAMFGNASFAGKTADLSNIEFNLLMYKQFEIGILKTVQRDKGKWNIGFGLSLLTGNRNVRLNITEASLYTDPDGEYLDGEIHGEFRSASMGKTQFIAANGLGFSGSFSIGFESDKFGIRLDADDLGFIRWSEKLKHTDLDSVFRFEGVEVNLFSADGNPFSSINLDSVVDGFATVREASAYSVATPGRVRLEGYYSLNSENWRVYAGIQYRIAAGYVPLGYVGTSAPLKKGFFIDGRFAYGGFGSWNLGLEVRKRFANVFEVRLGTNNLEGYLLPMVGTSQSAYASLAGFF
ncbi:MAG: hypothetical protein ACI9P8_002199 [Bacteroidia bacterium]